MKQGVTQGYVVVSWNDDTGECLGLKGYSGNCDVKVGWRTLWTASLNQPFGANAILQPVPICQGNDPKAREIPGNFLGSYGDFSTV